MKIQKPIKSLFCISLCSLLLSIAPLAAQEQETEEPTAPHILRVWFPDILTGTQSTQVLNILQAQIDDFTAEHPEISIDLRVKVAGDPGSATTGGILSTMYAAAPVAPNALPDLILLRRGDIIALEDENLVYPLNNRVPDAILEDIPESVSRLGILNETTYGLPYSLEVKHFVYDPSVFNISQWTFENVLEADQPFVFPAGRTNIISDTLLVQYLTSAGGNVSFENGLAIDQASLRDVLRFYEEASLNGQINEDSLLYTTQDDYIAELASGDIPLGLLTSSRYLQLRSFDYDLAYAPIPTESGMEATVVESWMWALTTSDTEEQAVALEFMAWMMDPERQNELLLQVNMLPSQRTALSQVEDQAYVNFVTNLLTNAYIPATESSLGTSARVIQSALAAVITQQRTADEAAQDVINQLAG